MSTPVVLTRGGLFCVVSHVDVVSSGVWVVECVGTSPCLTSQVIAKDTVKALRRKLLLYRSSSRPLCAGSQAREEQERFLQAAEEAKQKVAPTCLGFRGFGVCCKLPQVMLCRL